MFLFIGFALMAGGLAGSVVSTILSVHGVDANADGYRSMQTVLVLKYILKGYEQQYTYYGLANVSQNVALMLSAIVLWIAQSASGEYEYNLTL